MNRKYLKQHKRWVAKIMEQIVNAKANLYNMKPYLDLLYALAKFHRAGEDIIIREIGVKYGESTNAFLKGLRDRPLTDKESGTGKLYSIDIKSKYERSVTDVELKKYWVFTEGDSTKVKWDKPIDILFIDGNHTYEGCKADYVKYEPFVKQGGLILMHDVLYNSMGVTQAFEEVKHMKLILPFNRPGMGLIIKEPNFLDE